MNVAVINIKDLFKYFIKIIIIISIIFIVTKFLSSSSKNMRQVLLSRVNNNFLITCLEDTIPVLKSNETREKRNFKLISIINVELAGLKPGIIEKQPENIQVAQNIEDNEKTIEKNTISPKVEISKIATTQAVTDRNFISAVTNHYNTTKIDNQSNYTLTEDMLIPDVEITNKKDILIYHTHTCESYTPCDTYNYTMTGNYRTTDSNYNVIRVGTELTTCLMNKGFSVVHDGTYHDYPSYSGSYARSLETASRLIEEKPAEIVIDLHRDAVGNGDTYGPTVMVNGERVAQLMFVIGTDGGGLNHPNWVHNLKVAIKIQEKSNEMYPGLFRSIIIRNSRYNQHIAGGASIIEVGATANTLGECLLSMQCLANVIEEVCK